ncbi:TetR/AcrR family transcriptional regulator [Anaerocolumna xylanovorans]|uniref:Transcriptional regulator, TetR family n=1 Tax=Anaerocolumna xylanovorans DSM 12503 TaxID=1121345 RepID=A0A1M7Y0Y5_9FIRM|nr:TetR/AcrR family transcriptional regulator [Anaerocolumna xylanovorans]SHO45373.1 transcriptional regulator, TetR family [Anaerocolumna xylanovorans DSM 12503]
MTEFIRARSIEQKRRRMNEIMKTTDYLFHDRTYQEITLTTIAEALGWSRGNLYKYVTTKEEIFLELYLEKQNNYFFDIESTFIDKDGLTDEEFTDLWTSILDKNHDYLRYYSILATIIETNVTVERLAEFKKIVLSGFDSIIQILSKHCHSVSNDDVISLYWTLLFHACGLNNSCHVSPLVRKAMELAGLPEFQINFVQNFRKFMLMCLSHYRQIP